ncbi:MAG TPA: redoxin domain-containing protein [Candidatus Deferrimicrobium sp.]|nr:redoxin domain-containing protein [Candidatus Deferrimicrobium sp.]
MSSDAPGGVSITEDHRGARPALQVGDYAPDFTLPTYNEGELNLAWYRGRKNVVLAFYPGDFTPVCATQIPNYRAVIDLFERFNAQLLAVSVDSVACHAAWAKSLGGLPFPLMSDYFPHGAVAAKYGVLHKKGYAERTVFLIDLDGRISWIESVEPFDLPDNNELFRQLKKLHQEQAGK